MLVTMPLVVVGILALVAVVILARPGPLSATAAARRHRADLPRRVAAVAAGDNLSRILEAVVEGIDRPGVRGGAIFLINERNELYFGAHRGRADETVLDLRLAVGEGIMGRVAAEGRSAVVDDLDAPPPGVVPTNRNTGTHVLTRSVVAVPILRGDAVMGVLQVSSGSPAAFGQEDVRVLEQVARVMAPSVARANPLKLADEVLRRRVRELTVLQETAEALNASLGLDVVLRSVVERAAHALRSPYAAVLALDGETPRTLALWQRGPEVDSSAVAGTVLPVAADMQVGESRVANLPEPSGEVLPSTEPAAPLRRAAVVRLGADTQLEALLVVASADPRGFDPAQQRLLEGIAHLASLAVGNAVRYQHLAEVAVTDPLTGLLRRSEFERRLVATRGQVVSVLVLDVDHLRQLNDARGHESGDQALAAIAHAAREALGGLGTLGRTAGDEFGLLLPGFESSTAVAVAEELRRAVLGTPVAQWLPRVSIGVGSAEAGADPRAAWDAAIEALHLAKRWGRNRVEVRHVLGSRATHRQAWGALVPQLFEVGRIETVYQPIVRLSDRGVAGYEALARPAGFAADTDVDGLFAAARDAGLHRDLDWACRRAAAASAGKLPPGVPLFLNVGVWALIDPLHDVDQMLLLLGWAGLSPADVVLELSERETVHDLERLGEVMDEYRGHGFRFSMDDVGEGHSTLDMLAAGAPDFIKIARSLTAAADHPGARAAINAVVAFARSAGATVVAEGVETAEEAGRMVTMGVPLGQGYWLGPPVRLGLSLTGTAVGPLASLPPPPPLEAALAG